MTRGRPKGNPATPVSMRLDPDLYRKLCDIAFLTNTTTRKFMESAIRDRMDLVVEQGGREMRDAVKALAKVRDKEASDDDA